MSDTKIKKQDVDTQIFADKIILNYGVAPDELESLIQVLSKQIEYNQSASSEVGVLNDFIGFSSNDVGIKKLQQQAKENLVRPSAKNNARSEKQAHTFDKLYDVMNDKSMLIGMFIDEMKNYVDISTLSVTEAGSVIKAFYTLSDEEALDCLEDVSNRPPDAEGKVVLGKFAEAWLPVVFEHPEGLEDIRVKLEDAKDSPVDIPFCLSIPIELLLAKISGKSPSFMLGVDGNISASFEIGSIPEVGLDEDGKQTERAIFDALSKRCLSYRDLSKLEACIEKALVALYRNTDKTNLPLGSLTEKERVSVLRKKLERLKKKHGRSYYISCELEGGTAKDVFIRLKDRYPPLLFINKSSPDKLAEYERYDRLYDMIAAGKNVKNR